MKTQLPKPRRQLIPVSPQWWAAPAAFMATMLALPVNAGIVIPDEPLTSGARVAPNVLFILDDSGSMAWRNMNNKFITEITGSGSFSSTPDAGGVFDGTGISSESSGNDKMYMQNYITNTLYYNPAVNYQPWMGPDGNRLTGGVSFTSAFDSSNYATYSPIGTNGGSRNLSNNAQTFYVPKNPASTDNAYLGKVDNYYRYQIPSGGTDVVRAEYGAVVDSGWISIAVSPSSGSVKQANVNTHTLGAVPSGARLQLDIESQNSRHGHYELKDPSSAVVCTLQFGDSETKSCSINPTSAGVYTLVATDAFPDNNAADYKLKAWYRTTNRCGSGNGSYDWINCTSATPTGRSVAAELTNFATWFSYSRTRIKSAKAGATEAFRSLGKKVRVGYRTIWNRNNLDIPVASGDGRFYNDSTSSPNITNRTDWYNHLLGAAASDGTPLQSALNSAGQYFSSDSSSGPYGPESGSDQLSCRQNFTILTTDGYWNNNTISTGNSDNTAGSAIKGPKGATYTYNPVAPFKDSYSSTLADIAMRYWKTDLRTENYMGNTSKPDNNNVPTTDSDPAFWQHMVTFTISIGLKTTLGWSSVDDVPANPAWPDPDTSNPGNDNPKRIDDLLHAAVNGHGTFVAASSPSEFTAGLTQALAAIAQRTSSFSNVATNAASIKSGGKVFNANYTSGLWSGGVSAWTLDASNNPTTLAWNASIPAVASRKVYTYDGAMGATFPTGTQKTALVRTGGPVDYPATGDENADYIKGDSSKEERNNGLLRNRPNTVLGDIVGSSPAYVADTDTLYVGANDGMLHAFNAADGKELFAYVPNLLDFSNLAQISRGDYEHKFFVDGPVVVTNRKLTPSKNLLVGALGKGGKGLYGLDVTTPAGFGTSNVSWELGDTVNGNMGLVMGRPVLAKVKTGVAAAIIGNGVNSTNNKAVLIVVNAETGAVIREIDTGAGGSSTPNGLSAPTGILGPDGRTIAYAYAGDRLGNVWKFDLTNASPSSWTATKLFTAKSNDGTGAVQPITGGVTVATDPKTYKRWVFFGTGSFLTITEGDDKTASTQGMYGFMDDGAAVTYSDLKKRGVNNTGATQDGYPVRTFDAKADLDSGKKGWYLTLPGKGERIVQDAQLVANILVTASMIPEGDACDASGTGYINALDAFTGTSAGSSFFDLDGDGSTTDSAIGGVPVGSVNFGVGMPTLPIFLDGKLIVGGTNAGSGSPGAGGISKKSWSRVSWREIRSD
ncbi:MAG TPA: PilC/PilY family type IV pilus protein [Thermomonas sp.]|nr:PilC/PilY family type IV pilus protein [Thermomonas sp.]